MSSDPVTTSGLGAMNSRRLVDAILGTGAISRAQLARDTGLSKPTVSLVLARLVDKGLVREVGRTSGTRGATALLYDLEPSAGHALAMDVGRRWVRAVVVDVVGRRVAEVVERTGRTGADALTHQLVAVALAAIGQAGVVPGQLAAVTVGTPGVVVPHGDRVRLAPSLPGLQQPGVVEALEAALGVEVRVENDVNLAATAELAFGRGRVERDFVFLSVGTGVGLALVLDGRLRRGVTGSAGEVGYLPIPTDSVRPGTASTRRRGTFETAVNAAGLVRAARAAGLAVRSAQQVVAAARGGDERALSVMTAEAELIALGVTAVGAVVDPGLVVLGGGLGIGAADLLLGPLRRALLGLSTLRPRVAVSELGDHSVIDGAAASALVSAQDAVFGAVTGHYRVSDFSNISEVTGRTVRSSDHRNQEDT